MTCAQRHLLGSHVSLIITASVFITPQPLQVQKHLQSKNRNRRGIGLGLQKETTSNATSAIGGRCAVQYAGQTETRAQDIVKHTRQQTAVERNGALNTSHGGQICTHTPSFTRRHRYSSVSRKITLSAVAYNKLHAPRSSPRRHTHTHTQCSKSARSPWC